MTNTTDTNSQIQIQRELMKKWNDNRAKNESKALDKFYSLRRLFHPVKK